MTQPLPAPTPAEPGAGAHPVPLYLPFRGTAVRVRPGVILVRATAPSSVLRTTIDDDGVRTEVAPEEAGEAHLEARITLFEDGSLMEAGTIGFGGGTAVRFRSTGRGLLVAAADPGLEHGTVACAIDRGSGWFTGATGQLVSNFLVSRTGELTDHQLGLVFRPAPTTSTDRLDLREADARSGPATTSTTGAGEGHGLLASRDARPRTS